MFERIVMRYARRGWGQEYCNLRRDTISTRREEERNGVVDGGGRGRRD